MFESSYYDSFKLPFSGDVTQAINPWSWWSQQGLINVNVMASKNRTLEKRIVEDVAGYGMQLGRIVDLLTIFRRNISDKSWSISEKDKKALNDFDDMARGIAAVKAGYAAPTQENVNSFIAGLKYLKHHDVKAYEKLVHKLERELAVAIES